MHDGRRSGHVEQLLSQPPDATSDSTRRPGLRPSSTDAYARGSNEPGTSTVARETNRVVTRDARNAHGGDAATLVIEPSKGWVRIGARELWQYRELLYFLTWRNILIRYKQAVLGVLWAVLNPVIMMVVFTIVFNRMLGVDSGAYGVPYAVFTFSGLLPWNLFALSLASAGMSVVGNANLVSKVYFPRLMIPSSAVLSSLPDFLLGFAVLVALMAAYQVAPTWNVVFLPFFVLLAMVTALGVSLWLSALYVLYRDVQHIIPFLVQLWFFLTPVFYPTDKIPAGWQSVVYNLNPMTGVVGGFRWALLGQQAPGTLFWLSAAVSLVALASGLVYFRRMERVFADVV